MPIEHPSMRRAKENPNPQPKRETYVVEDASQEQSTQPLPEMPVPQHIVSGQAPAPAAPAPSQQTPEIPNRSLIEELLFLGQASKEVEIGKLKFKLYTLTHDENTQLMKQLYNFGDGADLFTIRSLTLAHAVKSVNDMPFESLEVEGQFETDYDKKLAILGKMQRSVVEKLHDAFTELTEEADEAVSSDAIKN